MRRTGLVVVLYLLAATGIAAASFFIGTIRDWVLGIPRTISAADMLFAIAPLALGATSFLLCIGALRASTSRPRPRFVFLYTVALSPWAFGYPGWMITLFIWMMFFATDHVKRDPNQQARLIVDSPEVRQLIVEQGIRDLAAEAYWKERHSPEEVQRRMADQATRWDELVPGRKEFLHRLAD